MSNLMIIQVSSVQVNSKVKFPFIGLPCSDSAYRQKVQEINDEKYIFQNEIVSQNGVGTLDLYPTVSNHHSS